MATKGVQVAIGIDSSAIKPGMDNAARLVQSGATQVNGALQGWVGNTAAVATGMEKLEKQLKGFASEQKQQGKMARFYAGEVLSIVPAAESAKGAIQGILGVGVEALAGGVSLGLAFEAVKFGIETVGAEAKREADIMKSLGEISLASATIQQQGWDRIRDSITPATEAVKAYRDALKDVAPQIDAAFKSADEIREKGPGFVAYLKAAFGDPSSMDKWTARLEAAAAALRGAMSAASNQGDIAAAVAQEAQKKAQLPAANKQIAADNERIRESSARTKEILAQTAIVMAEVSGATFDQLEDERLKLQVLQLQNQQRQASLKLNYAEAAAIGRMIEAERRASEARKRERTLGFESGPMFGPGNDLGAEQFASNQAWNGMFGPGTNDGADEFSQNMEKINKQLADQKELWGSIGASVASAFGSIGEMIGGTAGRIVSWLGQMITQAIQLAIALAGASSAWTTPLGAIAIAGTVAAGLMALVSSVSARADGGPITGFRPYLVGERGPELIVPNSSGTVIPNHQLGGGTVNVTFNAPVDQAWWRSNERHIVRTLREAARSGRA